MAGPKAAIPWTLAGGLPIVRNCMDTRVLTVNAEMDILEAIRFLLKNHVTGAPVVDEQRRLVGMLSEKDCLKLLTTGHAGEVPQGSVKEFMTTDPTVIAPDTDLYFVAGLFLKSTFRRLPVVEQDGTLVGAITRFDILRVIHENVP
jgi:CBS domain-containing protein